MPVISVFKSPRDFAPVIILGFAILVAIRIPAIILEGGRLWAEEGVIYFHAAWYYPWYQAWFFIHTGYINLIAGFATWFALQIGGIDHAPAITVLIALFVQCLPVYIVITYDFPWRRSFISTIIAASLCALLPLTGEVWLNTITSQFHLGLCAALIFAAPSEPLSRRIWDFPILGLGSLSGPVTCFLFPMFLWSAIAERNRRSIINAAIVGVGFLVQLTIFFTHDMTIRGSRLSIDALLSVVSLHTIVIQFAGFDAANDFSIYLTATHAANHVLWVGCLIFLLFYSVLALGIWWAKDVRLAKLLVAVILISLISFYESLNGDFTSLMTLGFGERYGFIPLALNGLIVIGLANSGHFLARSFFGLIISLALVIGIRDYRLDTPTFDSGPVWTSQIPKWRKDSQTILFVWPGLHDWPTKLLADHKLKSHHPTIVTAPVQLIKNP